MRSLLHTLSLGVWALRPEAVDDLLPRLEAVRDGRMEVAAESASERDLMASADLRFVCEDGREQRPAKEAVEPVPGMVMVMDITGTIMKHDCFDNPGTSTMSKWLAMAESTPEVQAVVLNMDSPGGNGRAMLTLTGQMERMRKPIVGYVSKGMACSACYGIGATCDLLLADNDTDEFGSIGTYVRLTDWGGYDKQKGIKTHTIKATRSTQKLAEYEQALKADPDDPNDKNYEPIRKNLIDPFNDHFIALVQRNRPGLKDERGALAGRVFMAKEALELGMIDGTGKTLADAIAEARTLATTKHT